MNNPLQLSATSKCKGQVILVIRKPIANYRMGQHLSHILRTRYNADVMYLEAYLAGFADRRVEIVVNTKESPQKFLLDLRAELEGTNN